MEKKITLTVPDMHCSNCAMRLQALEDNIPGILQVDASYINQKMDVRFDDTRITEAGIIEAVMKAGYNPELR